MRIVRRIVLISVLVLAYVLSQNFTYVKDYWTVLQFTPSADVTASLERTKLTKKSIFLAEAGKAQFSDANTFNNACRDHKESGAAGYTTLGCYIAPFGGIYSYKIKDQKLEGIDDVVLVHEILHAAWHRLSDEKREELETELEIAYKKVSNSSLDDRMKQYSITEPGLRANELHSILPTEFSELTPKLEEYYSQYFTNRQAVVNLYQTYNKPFVELEKKLATLEQKILKTEKYLELENKNLQTAFTTHDSEIAQLNRDVTTLDSTDATEVDAYNARVSAVNAQANALNQRSRDLQAVYKQYLADITTYNSTGIALNKLNDAIDSKSVQQADSLE